MQPQTQIKNINDILQDLSFKTIDALNFSFANDSSLMRNENEYVTTIKTQCLTQRIDQLECFLVKNFQPIKCELKHVFTPGLYTRTITMPAGSFITSKIHKTEHQFAVMKGCATVWMGDEKGELICAGYSGITKAGTRRRLLIWEDCIWQTQHPTNKTTVEEVEEDIIEKHVNEYLIGNNILIN